MKLRQLFSRSPNTIHVHIHNNQDEIYSGEIVNGTVSVNVTAPIEVQRINLQLRAKEVTRVPAGDTSSPSAAAVASRSVGAKVKERRRSDVDGSNEFINFTIKLVETDGIAMKLEKGIHSFPFRLLLPPLLPSSFHFDPHNKIEYELEAYVVEVHNGTIIHDIRCILPLKIGGSVFDQNYLLTRFARPLSSGIHSKTFLFTEGKLFGEVALDKRFFFVGETLVAHLEVHNDSDKRIDSIRCSLVQCIQLRARGDTATKRVFFNTNPTRFPEVIEPRSTAYKKIQFTIPHDLPPSIVPGSDGEARFARLIQVAYRFKVNFEARFAFDLEIPLEDIIIVRHDPKLFLDGSAAYRNSQQITSSTITTTTTLVATSSSGSNNNSNININSNSNSNNISSADPHNIEVGGNLVVRRIHGGGGGGGTKITTTTTTTMGNNVSFISNETGYYAIDEDDYEVVNSQFIDENAIIDRKGVEINADTWHLYFDENGKIINEQQLRQDIFYGKISDSVRGEVWKYLIGYYPLNSTSLDRIEIKQSKMSEYEHLKNLASRYSSEKEETEKKHRERKRAIQKDVVRTDRQHPCYKEENSVHMVRLSDILFTYTFYNPELGYCQGMSDLLSPISIVIEHEFEAFWCFAKWMEKMGANFADDQQGIQAQLLELATLVAVLDPQLYDYLKENDCLNFFFCFRWILILFRREFSFEDTIRLWEVLWTNYYTTDFHLFVAVAILRQHRDVMIHGNMTYPELTEYINKLSGKIELDRVLQDAELLYHNYQARLKDGLPHSHYELCKIDGEDATTTTTTTTTAAAAAAASNNKDDNNNNNNSSNNNNNNNSNNSRSNSALASPHSSILRRSDSGLTTDNTNANTNININLPPLAAATEKQGLWYIHNYLRSGGSQQRSSGDFTRRRRLSPPLSSSSASASASASSSGAPSSHSPISSAVAPGVVVDGIGGRNNDLGPATLMEQWFV